MKLHVVEGESQAKQSNRIKKTLLSLLFVVTGFVSYAQDIPKKEPSLDGTEGEVFKEKDTIASEKKYSRINEFENDFSTLRFGGGFMYEHAFYSQDEESKDQVQLSPGFIVRDFRITMGGKLKTERDISWKVGVMYDGASRSWLVRESGVMIGFPKLYGHIFFGRTKEGYSLSKVMNGYSMWHVERAMAIDIIPILADGVKYMGFLPKQKINWNIGYFNDFISEKQSFSKYSWQFVSRIGYLPIYTDALKPVMHIGVNYRYGEVKGGKLQVRSRPEVNGAPYFVDTGTFSVNNSNHIGGEFYYRSGAFLLGAEYNLHMMNSRETNNPIFKGGEMFLAYSITGEVRPYLSNPGIFTFLKPKKSVFEGGCGGWEAILRFSSLDLTDGTLQGGEFWRITPMVNWYLSENLRFYFAYGYGVLDKDNQKGSTNFFQSRVLIML